MKLLLENFKCYAKKEFEFPDEGLILIDGPSGSGKSTIFKAILYALWGAAAVKKPTTFGANSCKVTLHFADMIIVRTSKPRRLLVGELEDDPAQAFINKKLGMTWQQFLHSSYIQQKNNASILSLPPSEMLDMIKTCSYEGENTQILSEKLKGLIKTTADTLLLKRGELAALQNQRNDLGNELLPIEFPLPLQGQTQEIVLSIYYSRRKNFPKIFQELFDEKVKFQKEIQDYHTAKKRIAVIEEQQQTLKLSELATKLRDKPVGIRETLLALQREIELAELYQKRGDLSSNLNELLENRHLKTNQLREGLGTFSQVITEGEIAKLQQVVLEWQQDEKREQDLSKFIQKWGAPALNYQDLITFFTNTILQCPNCEHYLALQDGSVQLTDKPEFECTESNETKQRALKELTKLSAPLKKITLETYLSSKTQLEELSQMYSQKMNTLAQLKALEQDTALEQRLSLQIEELSKKLADFSPKRLLNELRTEHHRWSATLQQYDTLQSEYAAAQKTHKNLETEREQLNEKFGDFDLDGLDTTVQELSNDILLLQNQEAADQLVQSKIDSYNSYNQALCRLEKLDTQISAVNKDIASLETRSKALATFKDRFNRAQVLALDNTISEINEHTQFYLDTFFPDNKLSVQLCTSDLDKKTFKIDVKINFKGNEYDNIQELSGGEFDRCTLASVCGINTMLNSPILMLDESLSALDSDTNTELIRFLSDLSKSRLILVCSHEAVRGIFDEIISS